MFVQGQYSKDSSWIKFLLFVFLSLFGILLSFSLSFVLGLDNSKLIDMRVTQLLFGAFGLALPALASTYLIQDEPFSFLQIDKAPQSKQIGLAFVMMIVLLPFINFITAWNEQMNLPESLSYLETTIREMQKLADDLTLRLLSGTRTRDLFANLFFLALVPAITEELFFRGCIQRFLSRKINIHASIWIVAAIFSAYHMQFFGFVPRLLLGALLGYFLLWSQSLYLPIIAHFTNNAVLIICYFLMSNGYLNLDIESIGLEQQRGLAIFSLISILALSFIFHHFIYLRNLKTQS